MCKKSRREKNTEYQRDYRRNHPERVSASNRAYYKKHKETIAARQKEYRASTSAGHLGEQIRAHRRSLGLSQQRYADALGVTQATLSMWERGIVPVNPAIIRSAFPEFGSQLQEE